MKKILMVGLLLVSSVSYASNNKGSEGDNGNTKIAFGAALIASGAAGVYYQRQDINSNPFTCNDSARYIPTERALRLGAFGTGLVGAGIYEKMKNKKPGASLSDLMIGLGAGFFLSGATAVGLQYQDSQSFNAKHGWFLNRAIPQEKAYAAMITGACLMAGGISLKEKTKL